MISYPDRLPFRQILRTGHNDPIPFIEAGGNFHLIASVRPCRYVDKSDFLIPHDPNGRRFGLRRKRAQRYQYLLAGRAREMHFGGAAERQLRRRIAERQFRIIGSRFRIRRSCPPDNRKYFFP